MKLEEILPQVPHLNPNDNPASCNQKMKAFSNEVMGILRGAKPIYTDDTGEIFSLSANESSTHRGWIIKIERLADSVTDDDLISAVTDPALRKILEARLKK